MNEAPYKRMNRTGRVIFYVGATVLLVGTYTSTLEVIPGSGPAILACGLYLIGLAQWDPRCQADKRVEP